MSGKAMQLGGSGYPVALGRIYSPPKQIYIRGQLPQAEHWVAVVGSRRATAYGKDVTRHIAGELARRGVIVVSGLAVGIDTAAHTAAVEAGGLTVAVLGGGLDHPISYPSGNRQLARKIIDSGGAIISEYPASQPPTPVQFPARNRIIAGLSEMTIVTEAAVRSGSLITATMALEAGREVMAVPGNINQPGSAGCNNLIKSGAHPLTELDDVWHLLGLSSEPSQLKLPDNPQWAEVYQTIVGGTTDGDKLLEKLSLDQTELAQALTYLELHGYIRALGGNTWSAPTDSGVPAQP